MSKNNKLKCVDFFCGGGGMSQGLSRAGIRILGALDNDPDCRETYEANHLTARFIEDDITKMTLDTLSEKFGIKKNDDKLIFVGCSPCQYWSVITGRTDSERKNKSHASRNLLGYFRHFVEYYRPGYVLVENVKGIKRNPEDSGLNALLGFFDSTGYHYKSGILEACWFGVPQTRSRYVLIASRVAQVSLPEKKKKRAIVMDAIGGLPTIKAGGKPPHNDLLHRSSSLSDKNIARLKLTPAGGHREHWANKELLIPAYKDKPVSFFRENYGRMAWDKPAPTITTKFFAIGCGKFGHPKQNRAISLREGALLQTFPKRYKFKTKSIGATAKLIGNAVPPKLAFHIGKSLVEAAKRR